MNYIKKYRNYLLALLFMAAAFNLYFIFLVPGINTGNLLYFDLLLLIGLALFMAAEYDRYCKAQKRREEALKLDCIISKDLSEFENSDIAVHDVNILQNQLRDQFNENCNLQDYITKWCHEVKLPLAAGLLMTEKVTDAKLKLSLQEQLEKINQQLNSALLGCKVQSTLFDMNIHPVKLMECVRTSIQNNRFFLMKNHFELEVEVGEFTVYTDKSCLVYVLDQLLNNAAKYAGPAPKIKIGCAPDNHSRTDVCGSTTRTAGILLQVEDNGEGIKPEDIRRIFEKGFTGSNHHNGKYRSTGMGLYLASQILEKLGHSIRVESEYGKFTRFTIEFQDNREFFGR
ncbi:MAG: ATP-binding protein [Lachnospiraceae bacterium]|nr:ATP-binding protein [Lachnospiraceae bacterium]